MVFVLFITYYSITNRNVILLRQKILIYNSYVVYNLLFSQKYINASTKKI